MYPSDELLKGIREHSLSNWESVKHFIKVVQNAWYYPDRFIVSGKTVLRVYMSTGGWSGNESIVEALQSNNIFWMLCWVKSMRGGHYWFEIRKENFIPSTGRRIENE